MTRMGILNRGTQGAGKSTIMRRTGLDGFNISMNKIRDILGGDLSGELYELMNSLSKDEIARGRYPYEDDDGSTRFPAGDICRKFADDWLKLAQELNKYGKSGNTVGSN